MCYKLTKTFYILLFNQMEKFVANSIFTSQTNLILMSLSNLIPTLKRAILV